MTSRAAASGSASRRLQGRLQLFGGRRGQGYHVAFPDLPDSSAGGASIQEAVANAEIMLAARLSDLQNRGIAVPDPTPLDAIMPAADEELVRVLVRAELPARRIELTLSLDETVVAAIDAVSPDRSSFLENAARDLLRRR